MKHFIVTLCLINLFSSISFADKICIPQKEKDQTNFCTGFVLPDSYLKNLLSKGINACRDEISKAGFKIASEEKPTNIQQEQWSEFIHSTQRALTFHAEKVVAFKKDTGFVDCVHELIHVFQQTRATGELSPKHRNERLKAIDTILNKKVLEVESLEKSGKKDKAQKVADGLKGLISEAKNLNAMSDGLDEVEAHLYIYDNCSLLSCSMDERETAVANLLQRAQLVPVDLRDKIAKEAKQIVKDKKQSAIKEANETWKPLDNKTEELLSKLLGAKWDKLIKQFREDGLKVVFVDVSIKNYPVSDKNIPESTYQSLERPNKQELNALGDSKILRGQALGKYLCKLDNLDGPALLLTKQATIGTAVHEYAHYLQSKTNSRYCEAVYGQKKIDDDFKAGKISRADHDKKLLFLQAINALAEKEVYAFLIRHKDDLDQTDNMNNELMLKSYEAWLTE